MAGFEDWSGRTFKQINLNNTVWKEADLVGARFSGRIDGLVINDVEVAPLIAAEMERRYPERALLRPVDADSARRAWDVIEGLWSATMARCSLLGEDVLQTRVDDEWSCAETFRHLVFVTDLWIGDKVLAVRDFHPLGIVPSFADPAAFGLEQRPASWPDVVAARESRMRIARDAITRDLSCTRVVLDEEWAHNWFANRDLDRLA
ncbi:MAG: hypothetical protein QOD30_2438 [Actinomycetota bacterium]|nr:hypothetical protein [Actinomycetota bacterium]